MEFLIRPVDDFDFEFHYSRVGEMLRPIDTPSRPVEGWGVHRIEVE